MTTRGYRSIGDVLTLLRAEFPDITISKIRFLESQGLVSPQRSPSGYRKFYDEDVERLRYVLRQQREHFLPLKVIRDRLNGSDEIPDDTDLAAGADVVEVGVGAHAHGVSPPPDDRVARSTATAPPKERPAPSARPEPPATPRVDATPAVPEAKVEVHPQGAPSDRETVTIAELVVETDSSEALITQLIEFGMLRLTTVGGLTCFDRDQVTVAQLATRLAGFGIEPRHLRQFRNAVDREVGLLEQLVSPLLRQRNPDARQRARSTVDAVSSLGQELRAVLLAQEIDDLLGR